MPSKRKLAFVQKFPGAGQGETITLNIETGEIIISLAPSTQYILITHYFDRFELFVEDIRRLLLRVHDGKDYRGNRIQDEFLKPVVYPKIKESKESS